MPDNVENEDSPLLAKGTLGPTRLGTATIARLITFSSSFSEGWDLAIFGTIVVPISRQFNLTAWDLGLLSSLPLLCAVAVCGAAGVCMDKFGRKPCIIIAYFICCLGCLCMALAPSVAWLGVGRCILVVGIRGGITSVTVYMNELSPAGTRGILVSLEEVYINMGILSATFAAWFMMGREGLSWRVFAAAGMVAPMISLVAFTAMRVPESPRHLQQTGREAEALSVLRNALNGDEAEARRTLELWQKDTLVSARHKTLNEHASELREFLPQKPFRIAVACWFARAGSGMAMIGTYFVLFLSHGMNQETTLGWFTIGTVVKTLALLPTCLWLIETCGRKTLFLVSAAGCCICMAAATALSAHNGHIMLVAACLVAYFGAFSIGYGPVVWAYCFEILPNNLRGKAGTLSMIPGDCLSFAFLLLGPTMHETHFALPYAVLTATNLLAAVFFWATCPETKGLLLEACVDGFRDPDPEVIKEPEKQ